MYRTFLLVIAWNLGHQTLASEFPASKTKQALLLEWRAQAITWNSPSDKLLRAPRDLTMVSVVIHLSPCHLSPYPPAPLVPKI
jgi:hypothetical protein